MHLSSDEVQQEIYNLILNPATRQWERDLLLQAKDEQSGVRFNDRLDILNNGLKPLATRNNLTPDVMDFYLKINGQPQTDSQDKVALHAAPNPPYQERAIFAGGCFWCMVEPFDRLPGIIAVISGYTGGNWRQPTYDQVVGQYTGHVEAVEILFDTRLISYQQLVDIYWQLIDPTDDLGQIDDRGDNYRPIIFVNDAQQRQIAEQSKQTVIAAHRYTRPIVVAIENATTFWLAENFHQDFYKKNKGRYRKIKQSRQLYFLLQRLTINIHRLFKK
ncbi:peptide-methionine (S)-S-oxide reductase MsrA [uncultured Leuconostoc sp.]|uniref:peptide-methionine (S)-S-oxide reductase MsrA n=1 Tax=uncultured Leuconostoc sp. TaxID=173262 RepID=UPI0025FAEAFB|nr:peptide-methionine (S)-S-oxide reductase MsrA [uncultured Leuconostoc sp.]